MSLLAPGQTAFFDVGGTASGAVGSKVYQYVILASGNDATLKFFRDIGLTDQIWEDIVLAADLARPHTLHAEAPLGNALGTGGLFAQISGTGASCYISFD